jgi:hypothetical protein
MSSMLERSVAQKVAGQFVSQSPGTSEAISVTMRYEDIQPIVESFPAPRRPNRHAPRSLSADDLALIAIAPPAEWLAEESWE